MIESLVVSVARPFFSFDTIHGFLFMSEVGGTQDSDEAVRGQQHKDMRDTYWRLASSTFGQSLSTLAYLLEYQNKPDASGRDHLLLY
jgi:hypothetical protein